MNRKVGFGGGCHWCTEAVFASLKGVLAVEQGWIASQPPADAFSEAVIVTYQPAIITLDDLIFIHLCTHAATSNHSIRHKYRSAVYWFDETAAAGIKEIIVRRQPEFEAPVITQVLPFAAFKASPHPYQNYYYANTEKPFCRLYIHPKLQLLKAKFTRFTNH